MTSYVPSSMRYTEVRSVDPGLKVVEGVVVVVVNLLPSGDRTAAAESLNKILGTLFARLYDDVIRHTDPERILANRSTADCSRQVSQQTMTSSYGVFCRSFR